ncbi:MAG: hypothetical protein PHX54_05745 [Lentimicrobiaceae bacterium]|nr:hypothetical protein [Lentimicrobiaceae bacterium]
MERTCLDCGEPLVGRADKKFCDDQCRNNYNNRMNSDTTTQMRNINHILRKNRRILAGLIPEDKTTIHKDKLLAQGFNFTYFTHQYITQKGSIYHFVYEYGYLELDINFYMLVHRKNP